MLIAANGSSIRTYGKKKISLSFPGLRVVHVFLLADVRKPILGSDFFRAQDLLIDISGRRLFRSAANSPVSVEVQARPAHFVGGLYGLRHVPGPTPPPPSSTSSSCQSSVSALFAEFPTVTSSPVFDSSTPKHGIYHTVPTSGPPVFARARQLFGDKLDVAREEFRKMMEMGIIRPSNSP